MEIKKYRHACLVLTKNTESLVIDPGYWSNDLVVPEKVAGVIVTHEHGERLHGRAVELVPALTGGHAGVGRGLAGFCCVCHAHDSTGNLPCRNSTLPQVLRSPSPTQR